MAKDIVAITSSTIAIKDTSFFMFFTPFVGIEDSSIF